MGWFVNSWCRMRTKACATFAATRDKAKTTSWKQGRAIGEAPKGRGHLDIPDIFGALDAVGHERWILVKSYRHDGGYSVFEVDAHLLQLR
jgi:hypothetical protein